MGFGIKDSVENVKRAITIENLFNKTLSIDAFNYLYQFLHAFRGKDNSLLKNYNGEITSHLSGLFYRCSNLLEANIRPIFCYDGLKKEYKSRWDEKNKNVRLTESMIKSSKELLDYMGISYVQAPSEGESQCVHLVENNDAWAVSSQDYDVLLFGGRRFIRNLSVKRNRKVKNTNITLDIEYIALSKFLEYHNITREQLVDISILSGNDFFGGLFSIGEKKAFKLIQDNKSIENITDIDYVLKGKNTVKISYTKDEFMEIVSKIRKIFLEPNVEKDYNIKKKKPDYDKLMEFMVEKNNFDKKRVTTVINKLKADSITMKQTTIMGFSGSSKKKNFIDVKVQKDVEKKDITNQNRFF